MKIAKILLVGTGYMSIEYTHLLLRLGLSFDVVGRSEKSCNSFYSETGVKALSGGLDTLKSLDVGSYSHAIIATSMESLLKVSIVLLNKNIFKQLIEKPGTIDAKEIRTYIQLTKQKNIHNIYVAYNRRFYSSIEQLEKRIKSEGGMSSIHFDFTEWTHKIDVKTKTELQLQNWFLGNSTHVVDLAFYLAGLPKEITCLSSKGNIDWHSKSVFVGSGITERNVLFSYCANWDSSGRWRIECHTDKSKYILAPLEKLKVIKKGSLEIVEIVSEAGIPDEFKPGLYNQVLAFLTNDNKRLITIQEQFKNINEIYMKMLA